jgi:hypothetical protein
LNIGTIELIGTIPVDANLGYGITHIRGRFRNNGKILRNLERTLNKAAFITEFPDSIGNLLRLTQKRKVKAMQHFKDRVNQQAGTTEEILDWIKPMSLPPWIQLRL